LYIESTINSSILPIPSAISPLPVAAHSTLEPDSKGANIASGFHAVVFQKTAQTLEISRKKPGKPGNEDIIYMKNR